MDIQLLYTDSYVPVVYIYVDICMYNFYMYTSMDLYLCAVYNVRWWRPVDSVPLWETLLSIQLDATVYDSLQRETASL